MANSDLRVLRDSEKTPTLVRAAIAIDLDPIKYPMGSIVDLGDGIEAHVSIHTNGTKDDPTPHPHRGVDLWHSGPHAETDPHPLPPNPVAPAEGIDLSNFQANSDFDLVRNSGRSFAFIKATEGATFIDGSFSEHWKRAGDAGLMRGAYHFVRFDKSPEEQVDHFLSVCASVGGHELPPVLDIETNIAGGSLVAMSSCAVAAMELIHLLGDKSGIRPLVYTMPGFWDAMPHGSVADVANHADLWVAHWGVTHPKVPQGWKDWTFFQYSSTANVPGVHGRMDVNMFRGSEMALREHTAFDWTPSPPSSDRTPTQQAMSNQEIQMALNRWLQRNPGIHPLLTVDGSIGKESRAVIASFQASVNLPVDSIPGAMTQAALRKV